MPKSKPQRPAFPKIGPRIAKASYTNTKQTARLYQADCLQVMDSYIKSHKDGCFDLIFADPPYFLSNGGISCRNGKMVKVDKGDWDKSRGPELNHEFNLEWLSRCQKLLTANGSLWVSGTHHVIHSVGYAMQQLGMKILNSVIWQKPNPPPNLSCRYFTHSFETLLWAAKNTKSKHTYNYQDMRAENNHKQMKDIWTMVAKFGGGGVKVFRNTQLKNRSHLLSASSLQVLALTT